MNTAELHKAASTLVEAAFDPTQWNSSLHRLAMAADATGIILLPLEGRIPGVPHSEGIAEMVDTYFREGWHQREERALGVPSLLRKGIMVDQDFITPEAVKKSAYYQELVVRTGFRWFAGLSCPAEDDLWVACFQRTPKQGPFTDDDQQALLTIRDQFSTTATFARRLGDVRLDGMEAALEATNSAFLFINRMGHVVAANRKAEALMAGSLFIVHGQLVAGSHDETASIQRQIAIATGMLEVGPAARPDAIVLSRPNRRGLILRAAPLPQKISDSFAPAVAMILIADPEEKSRTRESLLKQNFGLTPSEVAMASWLADGGSVEDFAAMRHLATATARQVAKQALAKTGTHRQSELVALVKDLQAALTRIGG
jgi:DNA-binding CsgD family transcriptional regulator